MKGATVGAVLSRPPRVVAEQILWLRRDVETTPMHVLKLVYLCHGWVLGLTDQALIDEPVEAWQYVPPVLSRPVEPVSVRSFLRVLYPLVLPTAPFDESSRPSLGFVCFSRRPWRNIRFLLCIALRFEVFVCLTASIHGQVGSFPMLLWNRASCQAAYSVRPSRSTAGITVDSLSFHWSICASWTTYGSTSG